MAYCITEQWTSTKPPQAKLTVTQSSETGTTATLAWTLEYIANTAASTSHTKAYSAVINGTTVASGSYAINGKTGTNTIDSGTITINKTNSMQTIPFSVSFSFNLTWSGVHAGTKTASGSIDISAKSTYTVSYNANGGSGAPSSQTKVHGVALTLSSTKPTRTGYTFKGWGTSSSDTTVDYSAGGSYTNNANITLYAIWQSNTFTVSYNANGGSGAPSSQTKTYGVNLTLSSTTPTRTGYTFKGWGTSSSATSVSYSAGGTYSSNASITLYAIWELAYSKPSINYVSVNRCLSDGTTSDYGEYVRAKFVWSCDQTSGTNTMSQIALSLYLSSSTTSYLTKTYTSSDLGTGSSGSIDWQFGSESTTVSVENSYYLIIEVTDSIGGVNSYRFNINSAIFPIDFLAGGHGVAIGKPASKENAFEVGLPIYDIDGALIGNGAAVYTGEGTKGVDPDTTLEHYIQTNYPSKCPRDNSNWGIQTFFTDRKTTSRERTQIAYPFNDSTGHPYFRCFITGGYGWTEWKRFVIDDGSTGFKKALYANNAVNTMGWFRYHNGWLGFYDSASEAQNNSNRQGWIGYDGSSTFNIYNSASYTGTVVHLQYFYNADGDYGQFQNNADNQTYLGTSNHRWKAIYAATSAISTSDRNKKKDFADIDERYENLFFDLKPTLYRLKDNESNRIHTGFISQDIEESLANNNLTSLDLAAFCKDKAKETVTDKDGKETEIDKLDENGNQEYNYSLRYEEFIALNTHMIQKAFAKIEEQQKQIDILQQRIEALEGGQTT